MKPEIIDPNAANAKDAWVGIYLRQQKNGWCWNNGNGAAMFDLKQHLIQYQQWPKPLTWSSTVNPDLVLVDAVKLDVPVKTEAIVKGDAKSYNIGAASIIAKVFRDRLMEEYDEKYPEYGFKKNKGYGTKAHIDAIKEKGICPIHRKTFTKNFSAEEEKN